MLRGPMEEARPSTRTWLRLAGAVLVGVWAASAVVVAVAYRPGGELDLAVAVAAFLPVPIAAAGVAWPAAAGSRRDAPVNGVDLFATILTLAGLEVPAMVPNSTGDGMVAVDGVSLTPILFDGAATVRDPVEDYMLAETQNPVRGNMRQRLKERSDRRPLTRISGMSRSDISRIIAGHRSDSTNSARSGRQ